MSDPQTPASKPSKRDWAPIVIGGIVAGSYLAIAMVLIVLGSPSKEVPYVGEMLTTLRDAFILFMMYLFGSNASSQRKTEIISKSPPLQE